MRIVGAGCLRAGVRGVVVALVLALGLVRAPPPAAAHSPHDDVFDAAVSPAFSSDNSLLAISRSILLRSTDRGATWSRLVTGIDSTKQPYSLAYGGGSSSRVFVVMADAVFRSDDAGSTWQRVLTARTGDLRLVATSSLSPDVAVVAGLHGASLTINGGTTWTSLGTFSAPITAVAFKKASSQVIFLGDSSGVLRTTSNAGQTWSTYPLAGAGSVTAIDFSPAFTSDATALIGTSLGGVLRWNNSSRTAVPSNTGLTDLRVTSIAYSANHALDATVYASTWTGGLFVSRDHGSTWSASNDGLDWVPQQTQPAYSDRPSFGHVVSALSDSATRETVVVLASFTGAYTSYDLGASWEDTDTLSPSIITGLAVSPQFASDGRAAVMTYINSAATSTSSGGTWTSSNVGLADSSYWNSGPELYLRGFNIAFSPTVAGRQWMYAAADPGVFRSSDGGQSWRVTPVPGFTNPRLSTATTAPRVFVSPAFATDHTVLMVDTVAGDVYRSTDEGASFQSVGRVPDRVHCLVPSPAFSLDHRLFACTGTGVHVSTDLGSTWTATKRLVMHDLAIIGGGGSPETWFAATAVGLFRSTNLGTSWSAVALPAPAGGGASIGAVAASPPSAQAATILVSTKGRGMFRSVNGGATFTQVGAPLLATNEQFDTYRFRNAGSPIVFSPAFAKDRTIFGSSHDHLFRSTDGGSTWQRMEVPRATHTGPFPTVPNAPAIGTATAGPGSVSVAFTRGSDGNAPVLRFDATCTSTNGGTAGNGSAAASPVLVGGLSNGKTYTCQVTATNGLGAGSASAASNAVVPRAAPGAPTGVTAAVGSGGVTVSWIAPASNGGSPITGYVVTPYDGFHVVPPTMVTSSATSQTVTGLTSGTSYRFKVAAINAVGTGPRSTLSNAVTPP